MDHSQLSKEVSYALRHAPWKYKLVLDHEGWVNIEQLLLGLHLNKQWESVDESDLVQMIEVSAKKRHEIANGRIRAIYGHSTPQKIIKSADIPPSILYHGTARHSVDTILIQGLQPMGRQYVHLSSDQNTAIIVGKRKDSTPAVLRIDAGKAADEEIAFYRENNNVWLADFIPSKYITIEE